MNTVLAYLDEVNKEMRKVNWPSWPELLSNTIITIVASLVVAFLIFAADRVISVVLEGVYALSG